MSGKAINGQRQHSDIHQCDGQAAECCRDGFTAQAVAGFRDQKHCQHIAQAAAHAKAQALPQRKGLGALYQHGAQHTAVETGQRYDAEQLAAVGQRSAQQQKQLPARQTTAMQAT